ncbi:MAG: hypothetical protein LKG31_01975 [Lactobacillus sp.]|jgi:hypothetical protein|nr:hypothetical protein [Lactobacillus sp.]
MTRSELKSRAKTQLNGNWGWAVGLIFLVWLISALLLDASKRSTTGRGYFDDYYRFLNSDYWAVVGGNMWLFELLTIIAGIFAVLLIWGTAYSLLNFIDTGEKWPIGRALFSAMESKTFKNSFLTCFFDQFVFKFMEHLINSAWHY